MRGGGGGGSNCDSTTKDVVWCRGQGWQHQTELDSKNTIYRREYFFSTITLVVFSWFGAGFKSRVRYRMREPKKKNNAEGKFAFWLLLLQLCHKTKNNVSGIKKFLNFLEAPLPEQVNLSLIKSTCSLGSFHQFEISLRIALLKQWALRANSRGQRHKKRTGKISTLNGT